MRLQRKLEVPYRLVKHLYLDLKGSGKLLKNFKQESLVHICIFRKIISVAACSQDCKGTSLEVGRLFQEAVTVIQGKFNDGLD